MQPVEAQKGLSSRSQLVDSLKVYLNNKNRLQPIIGLGSIIECVNAGTHNREALYLCEVCACRLSKSDMRNHIMGSLHRYSYIKAWHPHLVSEWKESDLSKLAWPLMEKAKILEEQEGPGDVQLLEVGDAVYQKMATHSENYAVTLITILRDGQGHGEPEATSVKLEHDPVQSQRIVLPPQNQRSGSKKSPKNTSLNEESETSSSFFDGYVGTQPLIGLYRMVECRGEDGHTYCFLCHCCRIRCNTKDIIDHLTRSSHLVNYLMETYPEQADVEGSYQLLQPLAKKVEREEGRGKPKVVKAPESLCVILTGKSYHWCINKLSIGLTHTNQKWKKSVKGPSVKKASNRGVPEKCAVVPSPRAKRKTAKRKLKEKTNTVFRVRLPITKGSVLLERTSVGIDRLHESTAYSPDLDRTPSPESQFEDYELDYEAAFNHAEQTSQLQQDFSRGDADAGQCTGQERNFTFTHTQFQETDFSDNEYMNQWEDGTGKKTQKVYRDDNYDRHYGSQERSSKRIYKEWQNEGPQTPNEWPAGSHTHEWPAGSHTHDWPYYNSFYGHEAGCAEQRHSSASQSQFGVSREERQNEMLAQHYYQLQPQNQYMAQDHTSLQRGSVGQHGLPDESTARSDAARNDTHPHLVEFVAHSGGVAAEQRARCLEIEHRRLQTYMEFPIGQVHTAQQSYMTQPMGYQAFQVGHGMMSNPSYTIGPGPNSDQHFIPPGQALPYGAHSDLSFRAAGLSDFTSSGRSDGTTPYMYAYPNFHSAYIATPQ